MEEKKCCGFWNFQLFCTGFSPSLWTYLPLVFDVSDLQSGVQVDVFFVVLITISFCLSAFLLTGPSATGLLEFTGDPLQTMFAWISPAETAEKQRLLPVSSSGNSVPDGTHQMPARALLYEVSVGPYWEVPPGQVTCR